MLSEAQTKEFKQNGYLVIPNYFDPKPLMSQASQLLSKFDPSQPSSKFITSSDIRTQHFLDSSTNISYFLEEAQEAPYVNKIGHALHVLDPIFAPFSKNDSVAGIAKSLGFKDPRILQSMLIFKQAKVGGVVPPHVDSTFLYTDPPSAVGFWFALEDCTLSNGCLSFAPGSHLKYPLQKRFIRKDGGTTMVPFPTESSLGHASEPPEPDYVPVEVKAGSLVLIDGLAYHKSGANNSDVSRWIYTFHLIEGEFNYPSDNW